jgi:EmrB/QacA subfamily drug resistance transporter
MPVLMAGTAMIVLDFFIVNVALPSMQLRLHASDGAIEWVVAGYGLTFAAFLVTAGRLGDRIGRRRAFAIGLALFVITSAACGLAPDPSVLVVARLAQGLAAALISPNVLSIIGVVFVGPERVKAITVYGLVMGLAAVGGQILGGLLIQWDPAGLGWRTVFLINVPVGVVAWAMTGRLVPESRSPSEGSLDLVGMVLVTAGLFLLVLPLVQGREQGWPAWSWAMLALAPLVLVAFVLHQRRVARRGAVPVLDLALLRRPTLRAGLTVQLLFWCGQAAFFMVFALYLQLGHGLDPLRAGLVFTVLAVAYLLASLRAPSLTPRYGRDLIGSGALSLALGDALLLLSVVAFGGAIPTLVPGLLLAGAGMGLCITPLTSIALSHADQRTAGSLSGTLATTQQVGNALGVAVTGVVFFGNLHAGYGPAFAWSLVELGSLLVGVALCTRLLPRPPRPGRVADDRLAAEPGPPPERALALVRGEGQDS